uniref:Regulatory protein zeste n=1 Tax=Xenopsylla cheopis TaxID=163159 RepID=A0A6M2DJ51_XENCH
MQEIKRRERSANFTLSEIRLLSSLTATYRDSIENRKTDAASNKEKEAAWLKIESMFNAAIVSPQRTAKTLKLKYDSLKKATKKQYLPLFDDDSQAFDTEEKVLAMCSSVYGVETRTDSDGSTDVATPEATLPKIGINGQHELHLNPEVIIEEKPSITITQDNGLPKNNWDKWKPKLPRSNNIALAKLDDISQHKSDKVSAAQFELIQLQIEIAKRDHEFMRVEHELKVQHMKNEERRRQEVHDLLVREMLIAGNRQQEQVTNDSDE